MPEPSAPPDAPAGHPGADTTTDQVNAAAVGVVEHPRPPRPGDLTVGWRAVTVVAWISAILALAAVWNASVQLGLSTWWLGPRSEPQPRFVQFAPFVAPVAMVLATVNQVRRLPWLGLAASAVLAAIAVGDLDTITRLAYVEFAIAGATAAVSIASLGGVYRRTVSTEPPDR